MLNTFGDARGLFDDLRISEFAGQAPDAARGSVARRQDISTRSAA